MSNSIRQYFLGAGCSFLGMSALCILLYPEVFERPGYGVSAFGATPVTLVPYYIGFALTIVFISLIAFSLRTIHTCLSMLFWAIGLCMTGVALTSFSGEGIVYGVHWAFAILLALCIVAAVIWLMINDTFSKVDYTLAIVILVTVSISALPVVNVLPIVKFYIPRELLVFVASLYLLGRATLRACSQARDTMAFRQRVMQK